MILDLKDFPKIRELIIKDKTLVCTSGWYDPMHPGHIAYLKEASKLADFHIAVVNGDMQAITKKGKPFMPADVRAYIVNSLPFVDFVVIYDHPSKYDCCEALEIIKPDVFAKGGDRDTKAKVPEAEIVEENGGEVRYNIGDPKLWSSSNYLEEWVNFKNSQQLIS
jgi:D-beta-D-heptose 7-phosphate kinase/D-beta-D-heptose 1-phosphate adenosyltransferase